MTEQFNVCQFFENGKYEYIVRNVAPEVAVDKAKFFSNNVAAKMGLTRRVIITDEYDYINWEWEFGEGVTFPKKE